MQLKTDSWKKIKVKLILKEPVKEAGKKQGEN